MGIHAFAQENVPPTEPLDLEKIKRHVEAMLPEGEFAADILDSLKLDNRQLELALKLQTAIKQHQTWFMDYLKAYGNQVPLPYHKNFGITEGEYNEFMKLVENTEMVSSGHLGFSIGSDGKTIWFHTYDEPARPSSILDEIYIDLERNVVTIDGTELRYTGEINMTDEENSLKSKWQGYRWSFEEPRDLDISDLPNLEGVNAQLYKFTLGKLEGRGQTFLQVQIRAIENGEKKIWLDLPLVF